MARRANGEGSIYKLKDGRWRAIVSVRVGGKLKRRTCTRTRRADVVAQLERLKTELAGGMNIDRDSKLADYLDRWLSTIIKPGCRSHTYTAYEQAVRLHIKPRLPTVKLAKLSALQIEDWKNQMTDEAVGGRARQAAFQVLNRALDTAVYPLKLLAVNPCDGIKPPTHTKKKMSPFEAGEAKEIIDAASGTRWQAFYAVAFGCGLRVGELFGLKWSDIDWEGGQINIERQAIDDQGKLSINVPKTRHSIRTVDLPATTVSALKAHRAIQLKAGLASADCWLFPNLAGGLVCRANFYADEWKPRLARLGLTHRGIHNTRHTFATLALLAGVPVAVVSKALGHSSPAITLQVYAHVLPSAEKGAAVALDRLLG